MAVRGRLPRGESLTRLNWGDEGAAAAILESLRGPARGHFLIHLHGRYDEPERIVLGERGYQNLYVRSDETPRKLFAIFSMRAVVFFGLSFRDPDILGVFRQVTTANDKVEHFAVLPVKSALEDGRLRERFKHRYGIAVVFYKPGASHVDAMDQFPNFIPLMCDLAGVRAPAPEIQVRTPPVRPSGDQTWASRPEFQERRGRENPNDPQKGRFGGKSEAGGRRLQAWVTEDPEYADWFEIKLEVRSTDRRPLRGKVDLWVHDTFPQEHYFTFVRNGVARFSFAAYGAFTVGATCDRGKTALELDLAGLKRAPLRFRQR